METCIMLWLWGLALGFPRIKGATFKRSAIKPNNSILGVYIGSEIWRNYQGMFEV